MPYFFGNYHIFPPSLPKPFPLHAQPKLWPILNKTKCTNLRIILSTPQLESQKDSAIEEASKTLAGP